MIAAAGLADGGGVSLIDALETLRRYGVDMRHIRLQETPLEGVRLAKEVDRYYVANLVTGRDCSS